MAVAVMEQTEVVPTLEELAERANRHSELARQAGQTVLEHAIAVGEALIQVQSRVPQGTFTSWLRENLNHGQPWAYQCMRIARFPDVARKEKTMSAAYALVKKVEGDDHARSPKARRVIEKTEIYRQAHELRAQGLSYSAIGMTLGIRKEKARDLLNLEEARARRNAKRERYRQMNRKGNSSRGRAAAKRAGISEFWAGLHVIGQQMDAFARSDGATPELRSAVGDALKDIYRCRDKISKVLGAA